MIFRILLGSVLWEGREDAGRMQGRAGAQSRCMPSPLRPRATLQGALKARAPSQLPSGAGGVGPCAATSAGHSPLSSWGESFILKGACERCSMLQK